MAAATGCEPIQRNLDVPKNQFSVMDTFFMTA